MSLLTINADLTYVAEQLHRIANALDRAFPQLPIQLTPDKPSTDVFYVDAESVAAIEAEEQRREMAMSEPVAGPDSEDA